MLGAASDLGAESWCRVLRSDGAQFASPGIANLKQHWASEMTNDLVGQFEENDIKGPSDKVVEYLYCILDSRLGLDLDCSAQPARLAHTGVTAPMPLA